MNCQIIVTRPEPDASRWTQALRERGHDTLAFPLIAIAPPLDSAAVVRAHAQLQQPQRWQAVMFVSSQAVNAFFKPNWPLTPLDTAQATINTGATVDLRWWATGPGTRHALLQVGAAPSQIDAPADDAAQFDSEALWLLVSQQITPGHRVLLVRGGNEAGDPDGRDWLAQQLHARGAQVDTLVAYRRCAPTPDVALVARVFRQPALWLFSSSQAVAHWQTLFPSAPANPAFQAQALTTHPRITLAAQDAGFSVVYESRPTLPAVIAALESIA